MQFLEKFRLPFREDTEFGLLILMAVVIPLSFSLYTYENYEVVKYGLWIVFAGCWLILAAKHLMKPGEAGVAEKNWNKITKIFLVVLAVFTLLATLNIFFAPDQLDAIVGFYYRFDNSWLFYVLWAVLLVWLVKSLDRSRYRILLKVLIADAAVIALLGFLQSLGITYYGGLVAPGFLRSPSFLGNPNFSAMFVAALLPLELAFFSEYKTLKSRVYYGVVIFLSLLAVTVFSSRGAWLALIAGVILEVVLLALYKASRRYLLAGGAILILFIGLVAGFYAVTRPGTLSSTLSLRETNVDLRLFVWDIARQAMADHPWTGAGLGNFASYFEQHRGKNFAVYEGGFDDAHNLFLQIGATGGWPLLLAFLLLVILPMAGPWKSLRKNPSLEGMAVIAATAAWAVAACFNPVVIPCFFLLGVLLSGLLLEAGGNDELANIRVRHKFWPWLMGGVGGVTVVVGISFLLAEHLFYFGYHQYFSNQFSRSQELLSWAERLNPTNQLYKIYLAADAIRLQASPAVVDKAIASAVAMHPLEARSYVAASNLDYLQFVQSKQVAYLNQAAANLTQALDIDPNYPERYGQLAYYYLLMGKNKTASNLLQYGLSLDPHQLLSWLLLAKVYQTAGEKAQTIYALEQAWKTAPTDPRLQALLEYAKNASDIHTVPINFSVVSSTFE